MLTIGSLQAQISKPFDLVQPANFSEVVLSGDPSDPMPFIWSSTNLNLPNVLVEYSLELDSVNGDFNFAIDYITRNCCASFFQDTILQYTKGMWASFLNGLSLTGFNKPFEIGDTLELDWRVTASVTESGCAGCPIREFPNSQSTFRLKFIRGQFDNEYVPFGLKTLSRGFVLNVQGDPQQKINFSWSNTYCPSGCATPEYQLLIDTVEADFSNPWRAITIPGNDSFFGVDMSTINQALLDCRIPNGGMKELYWTVLAVGNAQVKQAAEVRAILLINGLLNNEHEPYNLINPINNTTMLLQGPGNTQLNFKWEKTITPVADNARYFLVFDTLGASPVFGNPIMRFTANNDGFDTTINLTYGMLSKKLDSVYNDGWKNATLQWSVLAQLDGSFYYAETPFSIRFQEGFITSIKEEEATSVRFYPNPACEVVRVENGQDWQQYRILSVEGKEIAAAAFSGEINVAHLPCGMYYLCLEHKGEYQMVRLVVQR